MGSHRQRVTHRFLEMMRCIYCKSWQVETLETAESYNWFFCDTCEGVFSSRQVKALWREKFIDYGIAREQGYSSTLEVDRN